MINRPDPDQFPARSPYAARRSMPPSRLTEVGDQHDLPPAWGAARRQLSGTFPPTAAPETFPTPTPWWSSRYFLGLAAFFAVFLGYLLFLQTQNVVASGTLRGISDVFVLAGSVVCALTCWQTAYRLRRSPSASIAATVGRAWIGWACLGGAAALYALGQVIWTTYDAQTTSFPFPATYDYCYLAVYPLAWAGFLFLVPRTSSVAGRTRILLDAGSAVMSALAISWYFVLGPTINALSGSTLEKAVALAYPLGDLSLCVLAALLLFGPASTNVLVGPIRRLALGVTWLAVTDSLYGYFQLQGVYHTGFVQDVGWPMAWLLVGWAAQVTPAAITQSQPQHQGVPSAEAPQRITRAWVRAALPMLLAICTSAILLLEVALRGTAPLDQVVLVCFLLLFLPMMRQILTLVDNDELTERLRVSRDQYAREYEAAKSRLEERVEQSERERQALEEGIRELNRVHDAIGHGHLANVRAQVEGPLAAAGLSLNLLIGRMGHWAAFEQENIQMRAEAAALLQALAEWCDGHTSLIPPGRSVLETGQALVEAQRFQRFLSQHFIRLETAVTQVGTHWRQAQDVAQGTMGVLAELEERWQSELRKEWTQSQPLGQSKELPPGMQRMLEAYLEQVKQVLQESITRAALVRQDLALCWQLVQMYEGPRPAEEIKRPQSRPV